MMLNKAQDLVETLQTLLNATAISNSGKTFICCILNVYDNYNNVSHVI